MSTIKHKQSEITNFDRKPGVEVLFDCGTDFRVLFQIDHLKHRNEVHQQICSNSNSNAKL